MPTSHPIARYLKRRKLTLTELAESSGVHLTTLSQVLAGKRPHLSPAASLAIDLATGGDVRFEDVCDPELAQVLRRRARLAARRAA